MAIGLVGRKVGMTRVFTDAGESVAVTVLHVEPNHVTQIKTIDNDGYDALQVTTGTRSPNRVNKPMAGHLQQSGVACGRGLWEFRLTPAELGRIEESQDDAIKLGSALTVDNVFSVGQLLDVTAVSKGKGFAGVIKRHNFATQDASHGNSLAHRAPGSTGQNQTPGRVFKGKKMAGQLGNVQVSIQNLAVVQIDNERNLLLVKGAVPGAPGGYVIIAPTVKAKAAA